MKNTVEYQTDIIKFKHERENSFNFEILQMQTYYTSQMFISFEIKWKRKEMNNYNGKFAHLI